MPLQGTELLLAMKRGGLRFRHLVDLKTIPALDRVQRVGDSVRIGALATHRALERSSLVREAIPVLSEIEHRVANVRVRAAGTLGGNLCFGEPHSDPATLLLCLGAHVRTCGPAEPPQTLGVVILALAEAADLLEIEP